MFKLLKLLLFAIFILIIGDLQSQNSIIKGNIKNLNGAPVKFATIQLLIDSTHHQSMLSDSLGNYFLKTTKKGNCELLINILGCITAQNKFTLKNDTTINFILQPDTIILKGTTINGQKDLIQAKPDRFVINIDGNIETKGKETTDIFKQLPTINISNESLNIFGKSSVIVYINDRIVRLEGQSLLSYLNSLPPDIISSIEIISTPPAQYDAEGNLGIIKVVTKKNILPGWKEYIKLGCKQNSYSSYMISAFVNYTGEKIFFEGSISNYNNSYLNRSVYYEYFPNATISTYNPKKWSFIGDDLKTSIGYNFNKRSNIIVDLQIPLYNKEIIADITNQTKFINPINNQIDSTLVTNGKTIKNNYTYNSEVFFKHLFSNKKSHFTASVAYLNNYTKNKRDFNSIMQINNINVTNDNFHTEGSLKYNILTPKIDFSFPIYNFTVNTGLKKTFIKTSSNSELFNIIYDNTFLDSSQSNRYRYTENILSVYGSLEKNIQKWSFNAGIRSEITNTESYSLTINEKHKNQYLDFFPTIYISNKLNNNSSISISYSARIERPPYQYLDPFKWYISKYDYAMGNPFLKPSYIKNIELTYLLNSTFSTKIYYTYQDNKIGQYVILDSLNILNQIQETDNFLNVNTYGVNIYKLLKLNNWLETVLQFDYSYSEYISNRKGFLNISGRSGTIIMNNTIRINKNFDMVCNLEEYIPGLYNYRSMKNSFILDLGLSYINSKKVFEARLLIGDIFKTSNPEYSYISDGIKQTYQNYYDTRMLRLVFTWKLGNWYNRTSKISSPSNIDEKQRL
ncbi:MAG TPA: outer membrane beta-barrel family protein [Bacteroidales bacterium]|nr:outer membrane beta-barrel family protein [Bacteroidales bacterium]HPS16641.1 outer membrane beta-barrel family protein [Bacteroidales bacterium]